MIRAVFVGLFVLTFALTPAWALENDTEYILQGEEIFVVFETIGNVKLSTIDGGILHNDEWYFFDIDNIKINRSLDDANKMQLFGTTEDGHNFDFKWEINGDTVSLSGEFDADGEKIMIIENILLEKLFF